MGLTTLFDIIYDSHYTILAKFYFYLQYIQLEIFSFNKINESQTNTKFAFKIVYQTCQLKSKFAWLNRFIRTLIMY